MSPTGIPLVVAADHPAYAGHFPGQPLLPGVVLLDEVLHALAMAEGTLDLVGEIKSVKFLSSVKAGEALRIHFIAAVAPACHFEVRAGERVVASGVFARATPNREDGNP